VSSGIGTTILASAVAEAEKWLQQFQCPEASAVLEGRRRLHWEVTGFFAAIGQGITTGQHGQVSEANKETFALGAWRGFFDGLRAGRVNMQLTKSTMKRGKALCGGDSTMSASSDKSGSSFSDSNASDRGRRKDSKKKKAKKTALDGSSQSSGKKKGKDGSSRGSWVKCQFQVHFPCSKKILGPELGVECSASGACCHCKKHGHWSGECPIAWAKVSGGLPGYSPRGKRYVQEWDGEKNPTKSTTT
jgi:hypothetical protein